MVKILSHILVLALITLASFRLVSGLDDVINALKAGNTTELSKYIEESVDISLPGKSDNYSKAQSLIILQDFFSANGVKNFEVKHRGDNSGSNFCIGILQTSAGNYRTTVFMKTKGERQIIKQISFQSL